MVPDSGDLGTGGETEGLATDKLKQFLLLKRASM